MLEVNFPTLPRESPADDGSRCDLRAGGYRNAKLEISDWTTAGAYEDEDSDEEEESEAESEDV
jgi:hypothetical protein